MKRFMLIGMLLGLLTGVGVAQRGRPAGPVGPTARSSAASPTARPDVDLTARRSGAVSPTLAPKSTTGNRGVSPTVAPIKDPVVGTTSTVSPASTVNQNVDPTAAPIRDPLVGASDTAGANTTVNRNVSPTAAAPIRDPK